MENMLVGAGIVFMAGALIGGGLSAFGVTLPLFSSIKRQVLLFLLGAALFAAGAYPSLTKRDAGPDAGPTPSKPQDGAQTDPLNAADASSQNVSQPKPEPPPEPVMGTLEEGVNRQGFDFDKFGINAANAQDCAELCRTNDQCVAMTYVISRRTCWLKKAVPERKSDPDHVSALKHQP